MRGKFRLKDDYVYKMPVHFGGEPFSPVRTVYGDMTMIGVRFETNPDKLAEYVPDVFEITAPHVNVGYANGRDVDWLWHGEGKLTWVALSHEQHLMQFRIIGALAGLPVVKYLGASMTRGSAQLNVGDSRALP